MWMAVLETLLHTFEIPLGYCIRNQYITYQPFASDEGTIKYTLTPTLYMQHIGFIMDGNRRWAKKNGSLPLLWHERGWDTIEPILALCKARSLRYVSMWALSKENILERPPLEIEWLYILLRRKLPWLVEKLIWESIRFETVGNIAMLPEDIQESFLTAKERTQPGTSMTFILAIGYSGQDEIIEGIRSCMRAGIDPGSLDEKEFLRHIDTGKFPPPDLIIRTGWRIRHSGYFLYQSAYSEYYFTDTLWPDFGEQDLERAIASYENTIRNFGK